MSQRIVETKQRMIQQRRKALRAVLRLCGVGVKGKRRAAVVALLVMQMLMSWPVMSMQEKPPAKEPPPSKPTKTGKAPKKPARTRPAPNSFVQIPAGEFMMGSANGDADEKPAHRVRISRSFEMGKYEVTQAQWEAVMGSSPSQFKGANLPVSNVSWDDAQQFIQKLNARNDGYVYRLPTEAEWEYACRAGSTGDYAGSLDAMAWYSNNSGNTTHPVGTKQPNAWGLYDMHGNVWEWCQDWYGSDYYAQSLSVDPQGPATGSFRVKRGGCWLLFAPYCQSAYRFRIAPGHRFGYLGFRLVRTSR